MWDALRGTHVACLLFVCFRLGAWSCLCQNIDVKARHSYFLRPVAVAFGERGAEEGVKKSMCFKLRSLTTECRTSATETKTFDGTTTTHEQTTRRDFNCCCREVLDAIVRIVIAIGFVTSLIMLSNKIGDCVFNDIRRDVLSCRREVAQMRDSLADVSNSVERLTILGRKEEISISNAIERLNHVANQTSNRCMACPCCWEP